MIVEIMFISKWCIFPRFETVQNLWVKNFCLKNLGQMKHFKLAIENELFANAKSSVRYDE